MRADISRFADFGQIQGQTVFYGTQPPTGDIAPELQPLGCPRSRACSRLFGTPSVFPIPAEVDGYCGVVNAGLWLAMGGLGTVGLAKVWVGPWRPKYRAAHGARRRRDGMRRRRPHGAGRGRGRSRREAHRRKRESPPMRIAQGARCRYMFLSLPLVRNTGEFQHVGQTGAERGEFQITGLVGYRHGRGLRKTPPSALQQRRPYCTARGRGGLRQEDFLERDWPRASAPPINRA